MLNIRCSCMLKLRVNCFQSSILLNAIKEVSCFSATISKAGILETATEECRGDASRSASQIKQVVSYGIGKYSTCPIARYQFAFLSILCELFKVRY